MDNNKNIIDIQPGCLTANEQLALMEMDAFSLYLNLNAITNRWLNAHTLFGSADRMTIELEQAMDWGYQQTQRFGVNDWHNNDFGNGSYLLEFWNNFYEEHFNSLSPEVQIDILDFLKLNNRVTTFTFKPEYLPQGNWQSTIPKEKD